MPKKKVKKTKKTAKKTSLSKVKRIKRPPTSVKAFAKIDKPVGDVVHYYGGIKVGIFKFKKPIKIGAKIRISGATTDFAFKIGSMQFNYKSLKIAPKGKQIGVRLPKRVRIGDKAFEVK